MLNSWSINTLLHIILSVCQNKIIKSFYFMTGAQRSKFDFGDIEKIYKLGKKKKRKKFKYIVEKIFICRYHKSADKTNS